MDILSYLSELIQTHKTIGISGLGTVSKKRIPGKYDAATHSFIPPGYTLEFTSDVTDDACLVEFVSHTRSVSEDTARYFVREFSEAIHRQLAETGTVSLGALGTLKKEGDLLLLLPSSSSLYGTDFYGLPAVKDDQDALAEEIIVQTPEVEDLQEPVALPEELPIESSPDGEPSLESVLADNAAMEENPGEESDEDKQNFSAAVEVLLSTPSAAAGQLPAAAVPDEGESLAAPVSDEVQPDAAHGTSVPPVAANLPKEQPSSAALENEDHALEQEIAALHAYRSREPDRKNDSAQNEELIWNLRHAAAETVPASKLQQPEGRSETPPIYHRLEPEPHRGIPSFVKIILWIVIIILMLGIVYFIKPNWLSGFTGQQPVIQQTRQAPPTLADTVPAADTTQMGSEISEKPADTASVGAVKTALADTTVLYEIIGASMHDQKEADGFIAQMKKSGINAKVVTNMSGKRLKISIATLKDEKSAQSELERLSAKLKIPGIYIYRNKQQ